MAAMKSDTSKRIIQLQTEATTSAAGGTGSMSVDSKRVQSRMDSAGFSHLICECSDFLRLSWCEHTSALYLNKDRNVSGLFTPAMGIVVFARKPTLVIPVMVLDSDDVNGLMEVAVLWGSPKRESSDSFSYDGSEVVGYLGDKKHHRGEIRTMLLEWLPAVVDVYAKDIDCTFSGHFGNSPEPDNIKMVYADAYCRLDEAICYRCRENLLLPA